ncbi:MAG: polyhydroxyalkanoic acid system family protein [Betaproteobacteria bacterium]|nr:polyhydroxyalkanoic acid system family protein [Betaproteobacteria bacterium]
MADIELKRNHDLGLKGARAAADKMAEKLGEKFDLTGDWKGNTLHFSRPGVNGQLVVSDHDMNLQVTLGFMLKMMKGPIEKAVHEQLDKVLAAAPAKAASKTPAKEAATTAKKPAAKKPAAKKK